MNMTTPIQWNVWDMTLDQSFFGSAGDCAGNVWVGDAAAVAWEPNSVHDPKSVRQMTDLKRNLHFSFFLIPLFFSRSPVLLSSRSPFSTSILTVALLTHVF